MFHMCWALTFATCFSLYNIGISVCNNKNWWPKLLYWTLSDLQFLGKFAVLESSCTGDDGMMMATSSCCSISGQQQKLKVGGYNKRYGTTRCAISGLCMASWRMAKKYPGPWERVVSILVLDDQDTTCDTRADFAGNIHGQRIHWNIRVETTVTARSLRDGKPIRPESSNRARFVW
jgi:hypothetical protein